MKPCEFKGWVELEGPDTIERFDTWARVGRVPDDDIVADWRIGNKLADQGMGAQYRLFRKQENAVPVKKVYVPRCKALPLP